MTSLGVHIVYICIHIAIYACGQKKIESYFSDRLTVSNIRGRNSRRIYRLALPLGTPEMLSSARKSRTFLYNAHLAIFVRRMTQLRIHKLIGKYRHLAN